jgi:Tol biopolymer transport system component
MVIRRLLKTVLILFVFSILQACSEGSRSLPDATPGLDFPASPPIQGDQSSQIKPSQTPVDPTADVSERRVDHNLLAVYEKSGNLWISSSNEKLQLTNGERDSRPRISADGKLVVFLRAGELWAMDINGSNIRKIYGNPGRIPIRFEFMANSHEVLFTSEDPGGTPHYDLNMVSADGGSSKELLPAGAGGNFTPSPGGDSLALVQPGKVITLKLSGAVARVVYQFPQAQSAFSSYIPPIAWLENGFGFKTVIPGTGGKPSRFIFIPAAGGQPATLAEFSAVPPTDSVCYISPDGSRVLYLKAKGENVEMHVINAGTADLAYLNKPRGKLGIMGWSPDSKYMLFWLDEPGQIWKTEGKTISLLTDVVSVQDVTWINDQVFLFLSGSELRRQMVGQPSLLVDTGVDGAFDFIIMP